MDTKQLPDDALKVFLTEAVAAVHETTSSIRDELKRGFAEFFTDDPLRENIEGTLLQLSRELDQLAEGYLENWEDYASLK